MSLQELTLEYQVPGNLDGETINAPFVPGSDVDDPDQIHVFTPGALGILDLTGASNAVGGQFGNRYPMWLWLTNYTANPGDVLASIARREDPTDGNSPLIDEIPYLFQPAAGATTIYTRRIVFVPQGYFLRLRTLSRDNPAFPTVLRLGVFTPATQLEEVLIRRAICCTFEIDDQVFPLPDTDCDPPVIQDFTPNVQVISAPDETFAIFLTGSNLQPSDVVSIIRDSDQLQVFATSVSTFDEGIVAEFNANQFVDDPSGTYTIRVSRAADVTCSGEAQGYQISQELAQCVDITGASVIELPAIQVDQPVTLQLDGSTELGDAVTANSQSGGLPVGLSNILFGPTSVSFTVDQVPPVFENAVVFRYSRAGCPDAEFIIPIGFA